MATIGVDIDLTVVDSASGWFDWCNSMSDNKIYLKDYSLKDKIPYNFLELYKNLTETEVLDYWRQESLYDLLHPLDGVVDVLENLWSRGHKIVFVSTLKGNHHKSKYEFVNRNFPFMDGFIGTKEKHFARVDMMIDDRLNVLDGFLKNGVSTVSTVLFDTVYTQTTGDHKPVSHAFNTWVDSDLPAVIDEILDRKVLN